MMKTITSAFKANDPDLYSNTLCISIANVYIATPQFQH